MTPEAIENTFNFLGYSFTLGRFLLMTLSSIIGFAVVFLTGYVTIKKIIWPRYKESIKKVFEPDLNTAKSETEEKLQKETLEVLKMVKELSQRFDEHLEAEEKYKELERDKDIAMIRQSVARAAAEAERIGYIDPYVLAAYCEIEEIYTNKLHQNSYVKDRIDEMKAVSRKYNKKKRRSDKEKIMYNVKSSD